MTAVDRRDTDIIRTDDDTRSTGSRSSTMKRNADADEPAWARSRDGSGALNAEVIVAQLKKIEPRHCLALQHVGESRRIR